MAPKGCLVLYGTVTGNSEDIARQIGADARDHGVMSKVDTLENFKKAQIPDDSVVIFVISTTGEGENPEPASRFCRTIKRRSQPADMFSTITYTVCGLGDTNYNKFCNAGKTLDSRMSQLGAKRFYDMCCADEGTGLEKDIEPWIKGLWTPLRIACGLEWAAANPAAAVLPTSSSEPSNPPEPEQLADQQQPEPETRADADQPPSQLQATPVTQLVASEAVTADRAMLNAHAEHYGAAAFTAPISSVRRLTTDDAVKTVWHMELDVSICTDDFVPGDALGVFVVNDDKEVATLAARLKIDLAQWVRLAAPPGASLPGYLPAGPCKVESLLRYTVDIRRVNRKALLLALSNSCSEAGDRDELALLASNSKEGRAAYKDMIVEKEPTLLNLLAAFPSCQPSLGNLLAELQPLAPRYYSISNSPLTPGSNHKAAFAFTVVEYTATSIASGVTEELRRGVATSFLAALANQANASEMTDSLRVFWKPTKAFHLPSAIATPCIMVGPGTGVAPFVGFIAHRRAQLSSAADLGITDPTNNLHLFFGCRHEERDFLYRSELDAAVESGALTKLTTAFSRDGPSKVYVQHRLAEYGKEIVELMLAENSTARIYICGDGGSMFKAVNDTLSAMLIEHAGKTAEQAKELLREWGKQERYLRDVWS